MNEKAGRTDMIYVNYNKRLYINYSKGFLSLSFVKFIWRQTRQLLIKRSRSSHICLTGKRIKVTQKTVKSLQ